MSRLLRGHNGSRWCRAARSLGRGADPDRSDVRLLKVVERQWIATSLKRLDLDEVTSVKIDGGRDVLHGRRSRDSRPVIASEVITAVHHDLKLPPPIWIRRPHDPGSNRIKPVDRRGQPRLCT